MGKFVITMDCAASPFASVKFQPDSVTTASSFTLAWKFPATGATGVTGHLNIDGDGSDPHRIADLQRPCFHHPKS